MRSRVELFEKIRRDRRLDDVSIRELADRHGVHRLASKGVRRVAVSTCNCLNTLLTLPQ